MPVEIKRKGTKMLKRARLRVSEIKERLHQVGDKWFEVKARPVPFTTTRGEILGSVKYDDLPRNVQDEVISLARKRALIKLNMTEIAAGATIFGLGAAFRIDKMVEAAGDPRALAIAIPVGGIAVGIEGSMKRNRDLIRAHAQISGAVYDARTEPHFKQFYDKGATHLLVDRKRNIHFVKAPDRFTGKMFRPLFSRTRTPVKPAVVWKEKMAPGVN